MFNEIFVLRVVYKKYFWGGTYKRMLQITRRTVATFGEELLARSFASSLALSRFLFSRQELFPTLIVSLQPRPGLPRRCAIEISSVVGRIG